MYAHLVLVIWEELIELLARWVVPRTVTSNFCTCMPLGVSISQTR